MQIRFGAVADSQAITSLINAAFWPAEGHIVGRERLDMQTVNELLGKGQFLVADENGSVVGCVYLELRGERSYLGLLSVDPLRQKDGLGSKLMNAAEEYCAGVGSKFMDLQIIHLREDLPVFYGRKGYVPTGTAPAPPDLSPKVPFHFVKMSKKLA